MANHTPGPWVGFADQGKCIAIMPAGREGDICTFQQPPSDDDARLMTAAPALFAALKIALNELSYISGKHGYVSTEVAIIRVKAALDAVSTQKEPS